MKLVDDWRRVVALSLSFWMQIAGLAALIIPELRYHLMGVDTDPAFLWWLGVLLLFFGIVGRVFAQGVSKWRERLRLAGVGVLAVVLALMLAANARAAPVSEAETLAVAVPFIEKEEGMRLVAYRDIIGVPTICAGSTRGVRMGMKKTLEECRDLLRVEVAEFRRGLHEYFTEKTLARYLTAARDAAYTSTAFNCGIRAIGRSTATRRLNAGDIRGGCQALTWWNRAGGRVVRGLVARRKRERAMCLEGL